MSITFLFPGQGSQCVGMGKSFFEASASVRKLYEEASDAADKDFRALCFSGPDTVLVQTENAQPAITLVSLAALQLVREEGMEPGSVAGHSVGEYAALAAAGSLSFADAIRAVTIRGAAMHAEATRHPGAMIAVFGLNPGTLNEVCRTAGDSEVQIANYNTADQIVLTGTVEGIRQAGAAAKARGAKLIVPLKVSGAWHSRLMAGAQEPLRRGLESCAVTGPLCPVISNLTAQPYPTDPRSIRETLVEQVVSPVRWTQSIAALIASGSRTFVEIGPGRVLSGLMKGLASDVTVMNVQDIDSLKKLRTLREAAAT